MIRNIIDEDKISELKGKEKNITLLNELFVNVDLSYNEERALIWLSTWETSTVNKIISAFRKIQ
ncbi:hypothetical protein [Clostridium butyricum]|uniref:hypothetical protein n=1 Tax=Clostridium butyricum TaxID=1492 RepID=UPI002AB05E5E|nr:hypothetical protein [Clostridium butyricum]